MLDGKPVVWDTDNLLRDRGFAIVSRPKEGQPIWARGGREFLQSVALDKASAERRAQLKKLEESFVGGM